MVVQRNVVCDCVRILDINELLVLYWSMTTQPAMETLAYLVKFHLWNWVFDCSFMVAGIWSPAFVDLMKTHLQCVSVYFGFILLALFYSLYFLFPFNCTTPVNIYWTIFFVPLCNKHTIGMYVSYHVYCLITHF